MIGFVARVLTSDRLCKSPKWLCGAFAEVIWARLRHSLGDFEKAIFRSGLLSAV